MDSRYPGLFAGYALAATLWWIVRWWSKRRSDANPLWAETPDYALDRPWRSFGVALLAVVGVLLVGQMWVRGWMFPRDHAAGPIVEAINQFLIFLPILAVPFLLREGRRTALIPAGGVVRKLLFGCAFALAALTAYWLVQGGPVGPLGIARNLLHFENLDEAAQVLFEDLAIGILAFRFSAALSPNKAILLVSALFAASHIPAMIAEGYSPGELTSLFADFGLGLIVLGAILRSGDIFWFWPVHFALDMIQFTRITGV